ncbi:uncharacterized protein LOC100902291 [Galendromus occidentalis]|uniref:Uncharacterized protein LOC100902291 n=1 Tax=Galendromus occidentalis TaxID=34638 RepID=A0AAJ6VV68_9ACAR|nr:uncharacterized protein LOC100902291 [Galendromus occidentalis]
MDYLSLDTINLTSGSSSTSDKSTSDIDQSQEDVLFDAAGVWTTATQKAVVTSLQLPVHQLPRRSSPLPSINGDEIQDPNLSKICPSIPTTGHWNVWNTSILQCFYFYCCLYHDYARKMRTDHETSKTCSKSTLS